MSIVTSKFFKKICRVHSRLHMKARTSPFCPKNEPSVLCRCYPYQRRSAVFYLVNILIAMLIMLIETNY